MDKEGKVTKTRLKGVNTPWYSPTIEDVGCWLRVKAAPVLVNGELGSPTVATTETEVKPPCSVDLSTLEEETVIEHLNCISPTFHTDGLEVELAF